MKGERSKISACRGPFPWEYSWNFDICQFASGNARRNTYTAMKTGTDDYIVKVLAPAEPKSVLSACVPGTFVGATAAAKAEPVLKDHDEWYSELPKDVNGLDTQPRTFSEFTIPNAQPYLIGTFCRQYVWQDTTANQAGAKHYARGWRSENETWVFLRNACDCPGPPDAVARACLPRTAGGCNDGAHGPQLMRADENCLESLGISPSACPTRLVGVSGGLVVFAVDGEAKKCFMYSQISGRRVQPAAKLQATCSPILSTI